MLEKGSYVPWSSRFLENETTLASSRKQEEKDLSGNDKKRFEANIDAMNAIHLGILNNIYNSVDACKTAQAMWTRIIVDNQRNTTGNAYVKRNAGNATTVQRNQRTNANQGIHQQFSATIATGKVIMQEAVQSPGVEIHNVLVVELKELNATCIMMKRILSAINDPNTYPEFVNEVHKSESCFINEIFSNDDHEQHETIKPSYDDDDQIDSSIIFDDSDGEDNNEIVKNDTIAHDEHHAEIESLMKSRIITVVSVDVKKKWGYGFLTSIKVKRTYNKEYEFSYAALSRLSLNDIEDMYLLKVQGKLHHLKLEFEIDFINALILYNRKVMIKNMIEDT
nr:hypothetical protein [Tanacetum cinerariifolium]